MSDTSAGRIFLSYRREDTRHMAGRLFDRLADRFGNDRVFIDVNSIEPGLDFGEAIERAISQCAVVLALIGRTWADSTDERGQRRLDDPDDPVLLELTSALEHNIRVIPVLVDGAAMPRRDDLPESLAPLARRNAVRLDHETFSTDIRPLVAVLERALAPTPPTDDLATDDGRMVRTDVAGPRPRPVRPPQPQTTAAPTSNVKPSAAAHAPESLPNHTPQVIEPTTYDALNRSWFDSTVANLHSRFPKALQRAFLTTLGMSTVFGLELGLVTALTSTSTPGVLFLIIAIIFGPIFGFLAATEATRSSKIPSGLIGGTLGLLFLTLGATESISLGFVLGFSIGGSFGLATALMSSLMSKSRRRGLIVGTVVNIASLGVFAVVNSTADSENLIAVAAAFSSLGIAAGCLCGITVSIARSVRE